MEFQTLVKIHLKTVAVTLTDGTQLVGKITSHTPADKHYTFISEISILEEKGIPVKVRTKDITDLQILDEENPFLNKEEI